MTATGFRYVIDARYSINSTGWSAGPSSDPSTSGASPGTKHMMSVMCPIRCPANGATTRIPSDIDVGAPTSTACSSGVDAPSKRMNANANGRSSGCCSLGAGTQVQDSTVPAGPTSTRSAASSAPVAGSHSIGGTSTSLPFRVPKICLSVSAVMNAPITGPSDRLYGKVMVLSVNLVTESQPVCITSSMDPLHAAADRQYSDLRI